MGSFLPIPHRWVARPPPFPLFFAFFILLKCPLRGNSLLLFFSFFFFPLSGIGLIHLYDRPAIHELFHPPPISAGRLLRRYPFPLHFPFFFYPDKVNFPPQANRSNNQTSPPPFLHSPISILRQGEPFVPRKVDQNVRHLPESEEMVGNLFSPPGKSLGKFHLSP